MKKDTKDTKVFITFYASGLAAAFGAQAIADGKWVEAVLMIIISSVLVILGDYVLDELKREVQG